MIFQSSDGPDCPVGLLRTQREAERAAARQPGYTPAVNLWFHRLDAGCGHAEIGVAVGFATAVYVRALGVLDPQTGYVPYRPLPGMPEAPTTALEEGIADIQKRHADYWKPGAPGLDPAVPGSLEERFVDLFREDFARLAGRGQDHAAA